MELFFIFMKNKTYVRIYIYNIDYNIRNKVVKYFFLVFCILGIVYYFGRVGFVRILVMEFVALEEV